MTTKQVCGMYGCEWHGTSEEVLKATNPFDKDDVLWGCPVCKAVNLIYSACDEPGCWEMTTCGTPTDTGYKSTCGEHRPKSIGQK